MLRAVAEEDDPSSRGHPLASKGKAQQSLPDRLRCLAVIFTALPRFPSRKIRLIWGANPIPPDNTNRYLRDL